MKSMKEEMSNKYDKMKQEIKSIGKKFARTLLCIAPGCNFVVIVASAFFEPLVTFTMNSCAFCVLF